MLTRQIAIGMIVGGTLGGLAIGAAAGWTLNGWRLSGSVQELRGTVAAQAQAIATLEGANGRCTASVGDVKGAVKQLADESAARARRAQAAMEKAARAAAGHMKAAREAMDRPLPAAGAECEAIVREAVEYARRRKAAP